MLNVTVEQFIRTYLTLVNNGLLEGKEIIYLDYEIKGKEAIEMLGTSNFLLGGFNKPEFLNAKVLSIYTTKHNDSQLHLVLEALD
jgi:hypothetical protein